jgi:hypothetical protein
MSSATVITAFVLIVMNHMWQAEKFNGGVAYALKKRTESVLYLLRGGWIYLYRHAIKPGNDTITFTDHDPERGIPPIIRHAVGCCHKRAGRRRNILDMHRNGNTVSPRAVCRYPERLVGKGAYRTAMGNVIRIFFPATLHDDPGIPVMGMGDLHAE